MTGSNPLQSEAPAGPSALAPTALEAICTHLEHEQRSRRRQFAPAFLLALLACGGIFIIGSLRPDLLAQTAWKLALQILSWSLCLLLFPAIGLGLVFPNRGLRIVVALGAVGLTFATSVGFSSPFFTDEALFRWAGGCAGLVISSGAAFLFLGMATGAFVERRPTSSAYWISGGVSLTALNIITWHCPVTGVSRLMMSHMGGVLFLMALACVVWAFAHRMHRGDDDPTR